MIETVRKVLWRVTADGESGALRLLGFESDSVTSFLGTSLHTILCVTWQLIHQAVVESAHAPLKALGAQKSSCEPWWEAAHFEYLRSKGVADSKGSQSTPGGLKIAHLCLSLIVHIAQILSFRQMRRRQGSRACGTEASPSSIGEEVPLNLAR